MPATKNSDMTFLQETAGYLWEKFGDKVNQVWVILPNRRGSLYLKKYLAETAGKTLWAPAILSIEDLATSVTGLHIADHFTLLFKLYHVHKSMEGEKAQPFREFMRWGQVLLQDFNDVDNYMSDAEQLYRYIDAARVLSVWNPDGRPLTDFQKRYLEFYKSLNTYYTRFREALQNDNMAYRGMAFRALAGNPGKVFEGGHDKYFIFAGFNALTTAEEKIIRHLVGEGKAEVIWDADNFYMDSDLQEAGKFLRRYRDEWRTEEFKTIGNFYGESEKQIHVLGVAKRIGQAKACGEILSGLDPGEARETAVVLADESLLIPMLNSVPPGIGSFNVTMGFPLHLSPMFSLLDSIFRMQNEARSMERSGGEKTIHYHYRDLLNILGHPTIIPLCTINKGNERLRTSVMVATRIRSRNMIFLSESALEALFAEIEPSVWSRIKTIFTPWNGSAQDALGCLNGLMENLRDHLTTEKAAAIDMEFVYQFSCVLRQIGLLLEESGIATDADLLHDIFREYARSASIPFYGEPLSGFQMMGMLETRTLDFRNIILLSANDDILAGGKNQQSFIPYDIRRDFNLPTYQDKEAVYAYHFYRLLQRSSRVWLIYNTEPDNLGGGERSRFIAQMMHELPHHNPRISITEQLFVIPPPLHRPDASIIIEKTDEIMQLVSEKAASGFAPSSLNNYLNCGLKFYFKELVKLSEPDEVQETIDSATLGSVIHLVLQQLYDTCKNKELTTAHLQHMATNAEALMQKAFHELYSENDFRFGKNLLIAEVAMVYLKNFLKTETSFIQRLADDGQKIIVNDLEHEFKVVFKAGELISHCDVLFKGTADRIDTSGGMLRIIDYKTGLVTDKELKLSSWDDLLDQERKREKSFQLMMYAFLYHKTHPGFKGTVSAGILSFRSLSKGVMNLSIEDMLEFDAGAAQKFEMMLRGIVEEIFNTQLPFVQTLVTENCTHCPYRYLCYRA